MLCLHSLPCTAKQSAVNLECRPDCQSQRLSPLTIAKMATMRRIASFPQITSFCFYFSVCGDPSLWQKPLIKKAAGLYMTKWRNSFLWCMKWEGKNHSNNLCRGFSESQYQPGYCTQEFPTDPYFVYFQCNFSVLKCLFNISSTNLVLYTVFFFKYFV